MENDRARKQATVRVVLAASRKCDDALEAWRLVMNKDLP